MQWYFLCGCTAAVKNYLQPKKFVIGESSLSVAPATKTYVTTSDFGNRMCPIEDESVFQEYIEEANKRKIENSSMRYYLPKHYDCLSIHYLAVCFKKSVLSPNAKGAMHYCKNEIDKNLIRDVYRG